MDQSFNVLRNPSLDHDMLGHAALTRPHCAYPSSAWSLRQPAPRPSLLKIDVQGFELEVLKGATALLPDIDAVYVEVSYIEGYEEQALHGEIERFLEHAGYPLDGRFNLHLHQGQPVQADLLFRRMPTASGATRP